MGKYCQRYRYSILILESIGDIYLAIIFARKLALTATAHRTCLASDSGQPYAGEWTKWSSDSSNVSAIVSPAIAIFDINNPDIAYRAEQLHCMMSYTHPHAPLDDKIFRVTTRTMSSSFIFRVCQSPACTSI